MAARPASKMRATSATKAAAELTLAVVVLTSSHVAPLRAASTAATVVIRATRLRYFHSPCAQLATAGRASPQLPSLPCSLRGFPHRRQRSRLAGYCATNWNWASGDIGLGIVSPCQHAAWAGPSSGAVPFQDAPAWRTSLPAGRVILWS